jgi:hypothetical protein
VLVLAARNGQPPHNTDFDGLEGQHGDKGMLSYRPKQSARAAVQRVSEAILQGKTYVIDLRSAPVLRCGAHHIVLAKVASPLLSNVYLTEVDRILERAKAVTRHRQWTDVEYVRFADDLVVFVDAGGAAAVAAHGGGTATAGGVGETAGRGERGEESASGPHARRALWISRL